MPKQKQRHRYLAARRNLPAEDRLALSRSVQQRFVQSAVFQRAECLALYSAVHNEVDTDEVARQALGHNKRLVYPRVNAGSLDFVTVRHLGDLVPGYMGVLEPAGRESVEPGEIDVVVVPGVAFALDGYRLGYGKGYYDRMLANCRRTCQKVGFAYEMQVVESLPYDVHDVAVSMLVTERRIIDCSVQPPHVGGGL